MGLKRNRAHPSRKRQRACPWKGNQVVELEPSLGGRFGHVGKSSSHVVIAVWTLRLRLASVRYIAHEKALRLIEETVRYCRRCGHRACGFSSHVQFTHRSSSYLYSCDDCADVAQASNDPVP